MRFLFFLGLSSTISAQTVDFTNDSFEAYVLNEQVVDTNDDANADLYLDANANGFIELSEVENVEHFVFRNNVSAYTIENLYDLSHFPNLKSVAVFSVPGLQVIEGFDQPNLEKLWVFDFESMERIDVSTFTQLEDLRIEGVQYIRELNLQNGYVSQYQSLFYSENIEFACSDSIAQEYDDLVWRMPNHSPMLDCSLGTHEEVFALAKIGPNPCDNRLQLPEHWVTASIRLYDLRGRELPVVLSGNHLDCANLPNGIYLLKCDTGQHKLQFRFAVQH